MQRENGAQGYNRRASKVLARIAVRCKYVGCICEAWGYYLLLSAMSCLSCSMSGKALRKRSGMSAPVL